MVERGIELESDSVEITGTSIERETIVGVLQDSNKEAVEFIRNDNVESFTCRVNYEQISKLSKLECFVDDSISYEKTVNFARRWSSNVECFITVTDKGDILETRLSQVVATDITNDMIRDFCSTFNSEIYAEFDPMTEEHENPHLSISLF